MEEKTDQKTEVKKEPPSENKPRDDRSPSDRSPNRHAVERITRKKNFYSKKECFFTKNRIKYIDYKNIDLLSRFIGRNGSILPSRVTGVKLVHQRKLAKAIKRARYMSLLPFTGEFNRFTNFNSPQKR